MLDHICKRFLLLHRGFEKKKDKGNFESDLSYVSALGNLDSKAYIHSSPLATSNSSTPSTASLKGEVESKQGEKASLEGRSPISTDTK